MKRDMELIRQILLEIEKHPFTEIPFEVNIEGQSPETVSYHLMLLGEAGLIEAHNMNIQQRFWWQAKRLTWQGHEFLDAARDDTLWDRVKKKLAETSGTASIQVITAMLIEMAKRKLMLP